MKKLFLVIALLMTLCASVGSAQMEKPPNPRRTTEITAPHAPANQVWE